MTYEKQIHKVKKDEKLADIAKKYKHKDWKNIWQAPENKKLVSKRKNPDQIEAGDVLTIPFNAAQWTEITSEIAGLETMMAADIGLLDYFESSRAASEVKIERLNKDVVSNEKWLKSFVETNKKAAAEAKKWGDNIDAIATVTQLVFSLGKMAKVGLKASKSAGPELVKLNAKLAKDAAKIARDPIAKEARKAAAKHVQKQEKSDSLALASLGVISDSFDRMTSPSFWGWTAARLIEGDSWSDAVVYDFLKESKKIIANQTRDCAQQEARLKKSIAAQEALIGNVSAERNAALARISDAKKNLKELEKLR